MLSLSVHEHGIALQLFRLFDFFCQHFQHTDPVYFEVDLNLDISFSFTFFFPSYSLHLLILMWLDGKLYNYIPFNNHPNVPSVNSLIRMCSSKTYKIVWYMYFKIYTWNYAIYLILFFPFFILPYVFKVYPCHHGYSLLIILSDA